MIRLYSVAEIVKSTREEVLQLEPIDIRTNTNLGRHEKEIPILKNGCIELNQLKVRFPLDLSSNWTKVSGSIQKRPIPQSQLDNDIDYAINKDRVAFDKRVRRINELTRPNPQTILVRFMDEPDRKEEIISTSTLFGSPLYIRHQ
jgi:hypothetical protein